MVRTDDGPDDGLDQRRLGTGTAAEVGLAAVRPLDVLRAGNQAAADVVVACEGVRKAVGRRGVEASPLAWCGHRGHEEAQYHLTISWFRKQLLAHRPTAINGTQLVYWPQTAGESAELKQQPTAEMGPLKKHERPPGHVTDDSAPVSLSTST